MKQRQVELPVTVVLNWSSEQSALKITDEHIAMLNRLLTIAAEREQIDQGEVSLSLVDDEMIQTLNREYREVDRVTDVLSFPMLSAEDWELTVLNEDSSELMETGDLLGDIVISVPTAMRQSEQYGHSIERELGFLFVHGFLHLIGYDHETEEQEREMFQKQEQILLAAGLSR